jgi:hypothetical protein
MSEEAKNEIEEVEVDLPEQEDSSESPVVEASSSQDAQETAAHRR